MGKLRDFLKRITGLSTPIGGISWSPPTERETGKVLSSGQRSRATSRFSDGDWLTAAIVAPERAATILQRVATAITFRKNASRQSRMKAIQSAVAAELSDLRQRYEAGGETDEDRCDACIAKTAADIIDREMTSYRWKLDEEHEADPMDVFRDTIRGLMKHNTR